MAKSEIDLQSQFSLKFCFFFGIIICTKMVFYFSSKAPKSSILSFVKVDFSAPFRDISFMKLIVFCDVIDSNHAFWLKPMYLNFHFFFLLVLLMD